MADAPTIEDRLAALEAKVAALAAALEAKVAALAAAPVPAPYDPSALEAKVSAMMTDVASVVGFKTALQKGGVGKGL